MTLASASRLDPGKLVMYSEGEGTVIGDFLSGDSDRGGVVALDVRLPRR